MFKLRCVQQKVKNSGTFVKKVVRNSSTIHTYPPEEDPEWYKEDTEYPPVKKVYKKLVESKTRMEKSALRKLYWTVKSDAQPKTEKDDWVEKPNYPPILELSHVAEENRQKQVYAIKLRKLSTVEEKLHALNMPRYYGWPTFALKEGEIPYNYLPFVQHITRTELHETEQLPVTLEKEKCSVLLDRIKSQLESALLFEHTSKVNKHEIQGKTEFLQFSDKELSDKKARNIIQQINRVLLNCLAADYPHLLSSQIDFEPRLEAFWRAGGFYPLDEDKKLRKDKGIPEDRLEEDIDRCFQYFGNPALQIRSRLPLPPLNLSLLSSVIQQDTGGKSDFDKAGRKETVKPVKMYKYDPNISFGLNKERMHAVNIAGFWPNDPFQYVLMSYLTRGYILDRPPSFGEEDKAEALHCQAILSSYATALVQACYHGFTIYNDVTYPFLSHTTITDGKLFNFYSYELNTMVLHSDKTSDANPRINKCYSVAEQELYHDIKDGKVIGWNDKTLINLMSYYMNVPSKYSDINMTPYLGQERVVSHIKHEERRTWLHDHFRYLSSRRPRKYLPPEIYDWERIYKIEFPTRPIEPRRRFFELDLDPLNDRKLSDHRGRYVPKALRKPGKEKLKSEEEYYPRIYPEFVDVV